MAESFQKEVPPARVNITLDLHTGGAQKKMELPLKLLVLGDFSQRDDGTALSDKTKHSINKNNFDAVLADYQPALQLSVDNTLAADGSELPVKLSFSAMKDFHPEQVVRQIPELRALLAMRNLLRDLKSNLLDNAAFRRELEKILKDEKLSRSLRAELEHIAPLDTPQV
ncbi:MULTISPECIES: type VI secretion system contractile sheath small subunit [Aquitalea]|uniref:Type VI secretion system protein ImpB n=1 Tax=Aquitalea magnusonii TaxID=332411 RepID=A0A318JM42_9NEIS|nr:MULTISPECIES: type VI secretion system contractile sheath small subunit [Aquitalea]PXX48817.1 type VI secretion system protein ImpB [Aquitalea magnusonii]